MAVERSESNRRSTSRDYRFAGYENLLNVVDYNVLTFRISLFPLFFFFSSRRRHTRSLCDWSSDVCSSDLDSRFRPPADDRGRAARESGGGQRGVFPGHGAPSGVLAGAPGRAPRSRLVGFDAVVGFRAAPAASAHAPGGTRQRSPGPGRGAEGCGAPRGELGREDRRPASGLFQSVPRGVRSLGRTVDSARDIRGLENRVQEQLDAARGDGRGGASRATRRGAPQATRGSPAGARRRTVEVMLRVGRLGIEPRTY